MPRFLVDKSKNLDLLEEQIYYNKIDYEEYLRGTPKLPEAEQLVEIDSNSVLFYKKHWISEIREKFSVETSITDGNIVKFYDLLIANDGNLEGLDYFQAIETQSKQVITYIDYIRQTKVIYTTKQYYDEKIKKPIPVPQKPRTKTQRDVLDEI